MYMTYVLIFRYMGPELNAGYSFVQFLVSSVENVKNNPKCMVHRACIYMYMYILQCEYC